MQSRTIVDTFRVALAGLWYTLRTQRNMRIHFATASAVVLLGGWLKLSPRQWAILTLTISIVLLSEMTNTVVEHLVDLVCPDYDPLAKLIKDVMAATVLLAATVAVVVGFLILGPPLWNKLTG